MRLIRTTLILVATVFAISSYAPADVKLPAVLSSHMVLQREMAVPIWGTAAAKEKVTVEFAGQKKEAMAGDDGKWSLKLDPLKTSAEPQSMTVSGSAGKSIKLDDILVGEVWVGGGQSNMDMTAGSYTKGDEVLDKNVEGTYPMLRLISKGQPGWVEATPNHNRGFSAMLFSFGLPLHKQLDVPVGLLVGAVGGTPSGYWLSQQAFDEDPGIQAAIAKGRETNPLDKDPEAYKAARAKYNEGLKTFDVEDAAYKKLSDDEKKAKKPPVKPQPPVRTGETSNGKVGYLYEAHMRPFVGYGIRGVLWDQGESGTAVNGVNQFTLMGGLIRGWRKEWGQGDFPFLCIQKPSGGGCAYDYENPIHIHANKFEKLPATVPNDGAGREEYIKIGQHPQTTIVTVTDLGDGTHPVCKSGYGVRAAQVALGVVYGQKVETSGPVYASHTVDGAKVHVKFTHVGQGLAFKNGDALQGFAVAGADKKFEWADAKIDGDTIVLSSAKVTKPQFVRYGWANRLTWANLFNKDGLPAIPFRTDE